MPDNDEPQIIINGQMLTEGQAMTVRVAVGYFHSSLSELGLGDDEHGKTMTTHYRNRLREVSALMIKSH
jgi:hypothetical protein